jgi:N-acylneuraminate cytidylyltransferase
MRPTEFARDDSPEWLVWRHALTFLYEEEGSYPEALLVVPPTAPLRSVADLDRCLDCFGRSDVDVVITVTAARRSPQFNMVTIDSEGTASLAMPSAVPVRRRQDAPLMYDMTTVAYVAAPHFVMMHNGVFEGRVRAVTVPPQRALDIDTALDFRIAELLVDGDTEE